MAISPLRGRSVLRPFRPSPSTAGLALPVMLVAAVAFLFFTVVALTDRWDSLDARLLRAVQQIELPLLATMLRPVDLLTSSAGAVVMWVMLVFLLYAARWWRSLLPVLLVPLGGAIDNLIGDRMMERARPAVPEAIRIAEGTDPSSFPSGHVLGAVLLYGLLYVIAGRLRSRPIRVAVRAACLLIIGTVGFGRLWYGAHWPSDVAAGYALGVLLLTPLIGLYQRGPLRLFWRLLVRSRWSRRFA